MDFEFLMSLYLTIKNNIDFSFTYLSCNYHSMNYDIKLHCMLETPKALNTHL